MEPYSRGNKIGMGVPSTVRNVILLSRQMADTCVIQPAAFAGHAGHDFVMVLSSKDKPLVLQRAMFDAQGHVCDAMLGGSAEDFEISITLTVGMDTRFPRYRSKQKTALAGSSVSVL